MTRPIWDDPLVVRAYHDGGPPLSQAARKYGVTEAHLRELMIVHAAQIEKRLAGARRDQNPRRDDAIRMVLEGRHPDEAAEYAGVQRGTVLAWLRMAGHGQGQQRGGPRF